MTEAIIDVRDEISAGALHVIRWALNQPRWQHLDAAANKKLSYQLLTTYFQCHAIDIQAFDDTKIGTICYNCLWSLCEWQCGQAQPSVLCLSTRTQPCFPAKHTYPQRKVLPLQGLPVLHNAWFILGLAYLACPVCYHGI